MSLFGCRECNKLQEELKSLTENLEWMRGRLARIESWLPNQNARAARIRAAEERIIVLERFVQALRVSHGPDGQHGMEAADVGKG